MSEAALYDTEQRRNALERSDKRRNRKSGWVSWMTDCVKQPLVDGGVTNVEFHELQLFQAVAVCREHTWFKPFFTDNRIPVKSICTLLYTKLF